MTLSYLDFERSENTDGAVTLDAMASVPPADLPAVLAEIDAVLGWLGQHFGARQGPLDEGGGWDADVQQQPDGPGRVACTLTLALAPDVADALLARFGID
jgi:hypothetical protein